MIYSKLINSVIKFAYNKHQGQVDKSNIPYICHSLHIAEKMPNEELTIIALCHDLLEDTKYNNNRIRKIRIKSK